MGLYLCVFDGDDELDGVEVGAYEDFGFFRDFITDSIEGGQSGCRFPTLMMHSDCDGEWRVEQARRLECELRSIAQAFVSMPPIPFLSSWQSEVAAKRGLQPRNLLDSFIDVDGEPLLAGLLRLCQVAQQTGQPILFQ
jgi:hypothetical protein